MKNQINTTIMVLGLGVVFTVLSFYYQTYIEGILTVVPENFILISIVFIALAGAFLSVILTRKILVSAEQQRIMGLQELHLKQIQEMMFIIKSQRHDFVNHLQVVYGLLIIGHSQQAQVYIANLYQDVRVSGETLKLAIPELTALLIIKMGVATSKEISLEIDVETNLCGLAVTPLDITTVLGNLINNAIEAVEKLDVSQRIIELKVFENSRYYIFQTRNPGYIDNEFKSKIFTAGFSTKLGDIERGLGLASAKYILNKYRGGSIVVSSRPECGVKFTVCIPKNIERGIIR